MRALLIALMLVGGCGTPTAIFVTRANRYSDATETRATVPVEDRFAHDRNDRRR